MIDNSKGNSKVGRLLIAGALCLSVATPAVLLSGCAESKTYYEGLNEAKETADEVKEQTDKAMEELEKMQQELNL